MPLIENSNYKTSGFYYENGHISTIYIGRFWKTIAPNYIRHRIELTDGDFLDVDFTENSKQNAVILCHGLEGASDRTYNNTSAGFFLSHDYSVFAWNNRSCSGEMNRLLKLYHHAAIQDLDAVVRFVLGRGYKRVYLVGFSLGAAQIMNYFGTKKMDERVKAGVAVSVPVQLKDSAEILKKGFNRVYLLNFIRKINKKLKIKAEQFPEALDWNKLNHIKTFDEIDEYFTAPVHGFNGKEDYYNRASPAYSIDGIKTPLLILNAADDPFLGENCYPIDFAKNNPYVFLEIPQHGGHCAFPLKEQRNSYSEIRAYEFFNQIG